MPRKIRQLKSELSNAGFISRAGKGSHTVWTHSRVSQPVVLSGQDGTDAKPYQERQVKHAIEASERR